MNPMVALAVEAVRAHFRDSTTGCQQVCFRWIAQEFKDRGVTQQHLQQLAALGMLCPVDSVRGGHRRYYERTDHPIWQEQSAPQPA